MAGAEPEDESTDPPPTDQGGAPSPASDAASSSGEEAAPEPQPEPAPALAETPETAEAEAGECADDAASVATTAAAAAWLRERITVRGTWTKEHDAAVSAFLSPAGRRLLAYTDAVLGLCVTPALPQEVTEEIQYFVKRTAGSVDATNIARDVVVGSVRGGSLNSLLRLMSSVISPLCLAERTWPATIKKEFSGQLHRFMASLTEESWEARGQTVLYIPPEDASEPDVARHECDGWGGRPVPSERHMHSACRHDKDPVLRLNTTLIHWTRQIKEVVAASHYLPSSCQRPLLAPPPLLLISSCSRCAAPSSAHGEPSHRSPRPSTRRQSAPPLGARSCGGIAGRGPRMRASAPTVADSVRSRCGAGGASLRAASAPPPPQPLFVEARSVRR